MPSKRRFDEQLASLEALRHAPEHDREAQLQKALTHKNNFVVAKASDLIRELKLRELTPDLLQAFHRFFETPEKCDPQCWAKNSISRTLAAFEYQEPNVFLLGMRHSQLEAVWGGRSDTAGTLRSTCALALVQCRALTNDDLLRYLIDLLSDPDKSVRSEVVRAIEQVGTPAASSILRLRAALGNDEPDVLGACYAGVLRLEGVNAIQWVARFLCKADDSAAEAALAIAGTHSPEGLEVLRTALKDSKDPWFRSVLLSAIALTRQDAATEFLLDQVKSDSLDSERAMEGLIRSMPSQEVMQRLRKLTAVNPRLAKVLSTLGGL